MPRTRVVLYQEADGTVPLLDWLDTLPEKAQDKCRLSIERLRELGHELQYGVPRPTSYGMASRNCG